jgi:hypothetical protein
MAAKVRVTGGRREPDRGREALEISGWVNDSVWHESLSPLESLRRLVSYVIDQTTGP